MLAPCHCEIFRIPSPIALALEPPEPLLFGPARLAFIACFQTTQAWMRESYRLRLFHNHTRYRMLRIRLGRQACGLGDGPACGGGAPERRGKISLAARTPSLREKAEPPGELQAPIAWFIPKVPPHHTTNARAPTGSASLPMVESRAVLRHCPGQHPKGALMDAQTVIAVCELLLVVVALVELIGRRDE